MLDCNFKDNNARVSANNVYWRWTVEEFLNKYNQINELDYVYILNGVGTPSSTIVLNKKGVVITSQGDVTFDAKGGNFHFEVTGGNVLIEKITFRNFNFTTAGGAIQWYGNNGVLKNCNFINNTAKYGGAIQWSGPNGTVTDSTFTDNIATINGGGIDWGGINGIISGSNFINNTSYNVGGGLHWYNANGSLTGSTFTNNKSINLGGGVFWNSVNGGLSYSNFTNNKANSGGAIYWGGNSINGILITSIFKDNTANYSGGAVYYTVTTSMTNCSFINSKSTNSNGIYARSNLNINNGNGIIYVFINGTLSGISIMVLNNETYYYPPNSNINFKEKIISKKIGFIK